MQALTSDAEKSVCEIQLVLLFSLLMYTEILITGSCLQENSFYSFICLFSLGFFQALIDSVPSRLFCVYLK